jgi:hypothetical protein
MKKNFVRAALTASLLCTTAGALVWSGAAFAQMEDYGGGASGDKPNQEQSSSAHGSSSTAVTNPEIGKALQETQKDLQANDFAGAAAAIKTAQAVANPSPIETYYINKFVAALAIDTKDYPAATKAYEANAASPVMPDADKKEAFHNLILLTSATKDWQSVVNYGKQLEAINGLDSQTEGVVALAYYNLKDMASAKAYAQKSIDAAKAAGKQPEQAALEIVMGAQATSHDQAGAVATLEQIILQYNKPDDWRQLTNVALGVKGIKAIDALYIYRLKDVTGGMAQPDDYVIPGEIANQLGYPTEALKFFQEGLSSGKAKSSDMGAQLSKARTGAAQDEHNLAMLAAAAAKSKTGEEDVKMAEDYWGYGRYADAEASARSAIAKGGLKDPSEGQMILGAALAMQGKYDEAVQTLGQVNGSEGRMKAAHVWSLYAQAKKNQTAGAAPAAPPPPPAH